MDQATTNNTAAADGSSSATAATRLGVRPTASDLLNVGRIALAVAVIGLGVLGLAVGDFALQWQPVPDSMPARTPLAYLTAIVFVALGIGLLTDRFQAASAAILCAAFFVWSFALHSAKLFAAPLDILSWLALCEILMIAAGALMLAVAYSASAEVSRYGVLVGRVLLGVCLPVFGASHFAYLQFTADMIPSWIPAHMFWAWFTGIGHAAAGIAILTGVLARLASLLFAVMVSGFVLLLHVPRTIADPASRQEWTMLVMAATIAGAAWCAAGSIAARRPTNPSTR